MFDTRVAEKYGIPCAVFIHNIYFWITKNEANGKHFHNGRYWTYNSLTALEKLFPYMSRGQIRTVIRKGEESGAIIRGNFNKEGYDRTNWFTLSDEAIKMLGPTSSCVETNTSYAEIDTACAEFSTTIPDINTDSKPDIPPISPKGEDDGFNTFWKAYPRKTSKATALKSWQKIKPDDELQKTILSALEQHKKTEQWLRDKGQFIPHPATWLNQSRWLDELEFDIHQTKTTEKPRKFERKEVDGEIVEIEVFDD